MEKGIFVMTICHTCGFEHNVVVCFSAYNNSDVINLCYECHGILKLRFDWIYLTYFIVKNMIRVKSKSCPWNGALISV